MIMLMQPNQTQPNGDPYSFIFETGTPVKNSFSGAGGSGTKKRILIAAIIGGVLLLVFAIAFSVLLGGSKGNTETLATIYKQQGALIQLAETGMPKAKGPIARNLAATTKLSMITAQKDVLAHMKKQGYKGDVKLLAPVKDSKIDALLLAAEQNNRYDETLTQIIGQQLATYQSTIKKAYDGAADNTGKQLLSTMFKQTGLLTGVKTE